MGHSDMRAPGASSGIDLDVGGKPEGGCSPCKLPRPDATGRAHMRGVRGQQMSHVVVGNLVWHSELAVWHSELAVGRLLGRRTLGLHPSECGNSQFFVEGQPRRVSLEKPFDITDLNEGRRCTAAQQIVT